MVAGMVLLLVDKRLVILVAAVSCGIAVYSETMSKVTMKVLLWLSVKRSNCCSSINLRNWKVSFGMCLLL
jgi:hypothetical protein